MFEHSPWIGALLNEGVKGQRLGIVGYSHWGGIDCEDVTQSVVSQVVSGDYANIRFFSDIAGYFGMESNRFYPRVVFFNFVPQLIGNEAEKYDWATQEQAVAGGKRALRIAEDYRLDKLIVFSGKAWESFPQTLEEAEGRRGERLGTTRFRIGHYELKNRLLPVIALRHPQGALKTEMIEGVKAAIALPLK